MHPLHIAYQPSFATDLVKTPGTVGFVFCEYSEVYGFELFLEVIVVLEPTSDDVGEKVKYCPTIETERNQSSLVVLAESDECTERELCS